jgi:hypothetical protein
MEKIPFLTPEAVGVKTTATVHPVDAASVAPHVLAEIAKSPVIVGGCSVAATPPVFEMVMFSAGLLDDPSVTVPKLALAGVSTIIAGASPVPPSVAVACKAVLLPEALPKTVSTPDLAPAAVGEKLTWIGHVIEPESVLLAHALDCVKSPLMATLVTVNCPSPKFDICTVCAAELCPTAVPAKFSATGDSCTAGGAVPIPVSETVCDRN